MVADGKMEVLINNTQQLSNKGESLRLNANQPHGYRNLSRKIATFHDIIHYPID